MIVASFGRYLPVSGHDHEIALVSGSDPVLGHGRERLLRVLTFAQIRALMAAK
jgi:hypothetical protein